MLLRCVHRLVSNGDAFSRYFHEKSKGYSPRLWIDISNGRLLFMHMTSWRTLHWIKDFWKRKVKHLHSHQIIKCLSGYESLCRRPYIHRCTRIFLTYTQVIENIKLIIIFFLFDNTFYNTFYLSMSFCQCSNENVGAKGYSAHPQLNW